MEPRSRSPYARQMKILRKRVRSFFALQSILMLISGGLTLARSASMQNISSACLDGMVALMFAGGWWTTRKPSDYRNPWAVASSLICVVTGAYIFWTTHTSGRFSRSGGVSVILGFAGLYLYSQGGRAPRNPASDSALGVAGP